MTGELYPLRGILFFHAMLSPELRFHFVGTFLADDIPLELLPRKPLWVTFEISIVRVSISTFSIVDVVSALSEINTSSSLLVSSLIIRHQIGLRIAYHTLMISGKAMSE